MTISDPGALRRGRLGLARLYLVCPAMRDPAPTGGGELHALLRAAAAGGVEIVQLRDKDVDDRQLEPVLKAARRLCSELGLLLIVNDRPALAAAVGADGVHVGQDDMSVSEVRRIVGPEMLIGLSTHAADEIDAVAPRTPRGEPLIDYIGVGPVHETPTKPGRPAVGQELVRYAAEHAPVPFFAIGGLDAGNLLETLEAGARRVCVLRAISRAPDPRAAARALRELLEQAEQGTPA